MGKALGVIFSHFGSKVFIKSGMIDMIPGINSIWFILLAFLVVGLRIYGICKSSRETERCIKVTLTDKQQLEEWVVQKVEPSYYKKKRYVLTFQASNKKNYIVDVSEWIFRRYSIGDKGKLIYKIVNNETKFIDFK